MWERKIRMWAKLSRLFRIFICAMFVLPMVLVVPTPKASAQGSWTQTTDIDFGQNSLTDVRIVDMGVPAYVELNETERFTWVNMIASGAPRARESFAMAYDEHNQVAVIFGGTFYDPMIGTLYLDDTWEYDYGTNTWTNITKPTKPPARAYHKMAYDSYNKVIVLFGGWYNDDVALVTYGDTWEYDVTTKEWNKVFPSPKPPARDSHAMTYDSANKRVILFGGIGNTPPPLSDTWAYDAGSDSWTHISTLPKPGARIRHDMAYDSTRNIIVLHGGLHPMTIPPTKYNDTWEFDCSSNIWTETVEPDSPGARFKHTMALYRWIDENVTTILLFGGVGDSGYLGDTWTYIPFSPGTKWARLFPLASPSERQGHGMIYDSTNNVIVLFGGYDENSLLNDTWVFDSGNIYLGPGYMISALCDSGESPPEPDWQLIYWNPISQPERTLIRIYLANSTDGENWGDFVGPDGTMSSYYDKPEGQSIWDGHDGKRYLRYSAWFHTTDQRISPKLKDITITWTTVATKPRNLKVERSPPNDIALRWDLVPDAIEYRIYESQNRFLWPWDLLGTVSASKTDFIHIGALTNGTTHFYIVRSFNGTFESDNSTMGVKTHLSFSKSADPELSDINWLSLPYNSIYKKASDIASELTKAKIRVVGKWNPAKQKAITYTYAKGKWKGVDFDINPGEGIFIAGLQQDFDWIVTGTDLTSTLSFTYYPRYKKNINWVSITYTGIYDSASSIVTDIEGSLLTPPIKIIEVGKWNPAIQTSEKFYWNGVQWTGTDFTVEPRDGIYFQIITSFEWPIKLLTPTVP